MIHRLDVRALLPGLVWGAYPERREAPRTRWPWGEGAVSAVAVEQGVSPSRISATPDVELDHERRAVLAGVEGGAGDHRRNALGSQPRGRSLRRWQHQGKQFRPQPGGRVLSTLTSRDTMAPICGMARSSQPPLRA